MQVLKTKKEVISNLKKTKNSSIGFIPTMGALHEGHLQLVKQSKKICDITIVSIFVNPTQFNDPNDFVNYPKTLDLDFKQLIKLDCDVVYTPSVRDLYDIGEKSKKFDFGTLTRHMEGKYRPGHFNGMATIVEKLFRIINPNKAFFGQKDLQQLQIVNALVKQINLPIEIISVPTVREKNGLAKSSRNNRLSNNEKKEGSIIYDCLRYCSLNKKQGINELKSYIEKKFQKQNKIILEYVEFVSIDSMSPITKWEDKNKSAICIAAYINGVRLIDNIIL